MDGRASNFTILALAQARDALLVSDTHLFRDSTLAAVQNQATVCPVAFHGDTDFGDAPDFLATFPLAL